MPRPRRYTQQQVLDHALAGLDRHPPITAEELRRALQIGANEARAALRAARVVRGLEPTAVAATLPDVYAELARQRVDATTDGGVKEAAPDPVDVLEADATELLSRAEEISTRFVEDLASQLRTVVRDVQAAALRQIGEARGAVARELEQVQAGQAEQRAQIERMEREAAEVAQDAAEERARWAEERGRLNTDVAMARQRAADVEEASGRAEERAAELDRLLAQARDNLVTARLQADVAREAVSSARQALTVASAERDEARRDAQAAAARSSRVEGQLDAAQSAIASAEARLQDLEEERHRERRRADASEARGADLERQLAAVQARLEAANDRATAAEVRERQLLLGAPRRGDDAAGARGAR